MVHEGWVGEWGGGARNEAFKEKRCAVVGGGSTNLAFTTLLILKYYLLI